MTQGEEQAVDPLVGVVVAGKYRIVKQLGEGGMGCVYLAEQQLGSTTRKVALKTLHKHLSHDPAIKARFDREAGTVAALEHPNTIQVYDFGAMEDGTLYLVMEFVQGRSVADILEKDGPMPPARVENILRQVCGSLAEAHGHGIVHRDLKPDNVVLCERAGQKDWVEVLDFGIAKRSSEHDPNEAKLTQQGMVLGTPPYMSPEQFTGQPVDLRSDIYALGVMTYEMLVGKYPFEANTAWEWASKHMTEAPRPIETQALGQHVPSNDARRHQARAREEQGRSLRLRDRVLRGHDGRRGAARDDVGDEPGADARAARRRCRAGRRQPREDGDGRAGRDGRRTARRRDDAALRSPDGWSPDGWSSDGEPSAGWPCGRSSGADAHAREEGRQRSHHRPRRRRRSAHRRRWPRLRSPRQAEARPDHRSRRPHRERDRERDRRARRERDGRHDGRRGRLRRRNGPARRRRRDDRRCREDGDGNRDWHEAPGLGREARAHPDAEDGGRRDLCGCAHRAQARNSPAAAGLVKRCKDSGGTL